MPPERQFIAIVDDDESLRRALEFHVRAAGYRCESFGGAEEFLLVAAICRAACVVCDIQMDGMSGLDLAVHPKITSLGLPVVLMTGSIDPAIEIPARALGAAFLRKPFLSAELLDAIVGTIGPPIVDGIS
jgi:FixJ family two-component response regulator